MTIGERIRFFRKSNNVRQDTFAILSGISQTHVSKIENNQDNPSDKLLRIISANCGIRYEWLKYGTGEMLDVTHDTSGAVLSNTIYNIKKFQEECDTREFKLYLSQIDDLMTIYKKKFKNFIGFDYHIVSSLLLDIKNILEYWIEVDEKYGTLPNNSLSYEECNRIRNDVEEVTNAYISSMASSINFYIPMITASWEVLSDYIEAEYQKQVDSMKQSQDK